MIDYQPLIKEAAQHPYPLVFATVSGAHIYGFPSPDSDYDVRGVHILPPSEAVGLLPKRETIERTGDPSGIELDLVTHDVLKFFKLLLKRNGYVLEQVYSPLIVQTSPWHDELKDIATGCITRHHCHHYTGLAQTQWALFAKEARPRVKPLLYVYRSLLTGIHLMRTGVVEANLSTLNLDFRLPYIDDLIERKVNNIENGTLQATETEFFQGEAKRLQAELNAASQRSSLPEAPSSRDALNDLLIRIRLGA